MNKVLFLGLVSALAIGAVVWISGSRGDSQSSYSDGVLSASVSDFDFGSIPMSGGAVSYPFNLTNSSGSPVVINKVYTSCMCTTASVSVGSASPLGPFGMPGHTSSTAGLTVPPGESVTVTAVFDPAAHGPAGVGLAERYIYLETNSASNPKVELRFRALVTN